MPKKQYDGVTNPNLRSNMIQSDMVEATTNERNDWEKGFKETTKNAELKQDAVLQFLGSEFTEEQFEALESKIKDNEKSARLFARICKELGSNQIIKNKEVFVKAIAGDILNLPEDEVNAAYEDAGKVCTNAKGDKTLKQGYIKSAVEKVAADEKQTISLGGRALADGAYDEKKSKDPCADDQKRKDQYTEIAARMIAAYTVQKDREMPSVSNCGYDYNTYVTEFADRKSWRKNVEQELKNDQDFAAFVQEYRGASKDAVRFKPEYMIQGWNQYKEALQNEKTNYVQFKQYANTSLKKGDDTYKAPYIMFNMAVVDDDFSKEEIKQTCKEMLDQSKSDIGVSKKDFLKAANLVVADTLLSPAIDKSFYDSEKVKSNGVPDLLKLNKAVIEMRDQILQDPIFQDVINSRPSYKDFVSKYKDAVRKEVNKKISSEKAEKEAVKGNASLQTQHDKFAKETSLELTGKEFDLIKETRENLKKYNEGKKPSDHMKRLTDALDEVIRQKESGKNPKINALEELNSAALNYYNKRQGMIFSPLTDDGKARLSAVEKLSFTTDKIANRCKEEFKQARNAEHQAQMGK